MDVKPSFEMVEVAKPHQSYSDENWKINNEIQVNVDPEFAIDCYNDYVHTNSIFIKQEVNEQRDHNSDTNKTYGLDTSLIAIKKEEYAIKEENMPPYGEDSSRIWVGSNMKTEHHGGSLKAEEMIKNLLKTKTKEDKYKCTVCDYETHRKTIFTHHLRTHTGEKPFSCTFCNYKSSQKSHLTQHQKIHTGGKPYNCTFCDYKSFRKNVVMVHIRSHTGEKPFKCNFCTYACSQKTYLTQHLRSHTGEKPYVCSLCDYKGVHKTDLTRHVRTHTGEKPYNCTLCDYKCSQKCTLTEHIKVHTGVKPFTCTACGYNCARKSDLTRHHKIHSGEKCVQNAKKQQEDGGRTKKKFCLDKTFSDTNKLINDVLLKCEFRESYNSNQSLVFIKEEIVEIKQEKS